LIQQQLGKLLQQQAQDPRFTGITITAVEVAKDLSKAKVYYSVYAETHQNDDELTQALNKAAGFFQKQLTAAITLRKMPVLSFYYDHTAERDSHMKSLIQRAMDRDKDK
jgi:ribosome-binding factor A